MDFSKYKNNLPYPKEDDYTDRVAEIAEINNTPMTAQQRTEAMKEMSKKVKQRYDEMRDAYYDNGGKIEQQFRKDVEEEFKFAHLPEKVKAKIHYMAYEDGHAHGYESIYNEYFDLVEIALAAWEAK